MTVRTDLHEQNRLAWNAATVAHNARKREQAAWLAAGNTTLYPDEVDLLGDVRGARMVHLQCNSGQDTLGLVQLGAGDVVGVDISDEAVAFAAQLSADSGLSARFERADVHAWLASAPPASADVVFCSYGWIGWLSELDAWARGVAALLAPGGRFVSLEFHPLAWIFGPDLKPGYPYGGGAHIPEDVGIGDYVAESGGALAPMGEIPAETPFRNPHACHGFAWGVADLCGALLRAGLVIERLEEYPHSNGCRLHPVLLPAAGRRFVLPDDVPAFPLMLGVVARKPR